MTWMWNQLQCTDLCIIKHAWNRFEFKSIDTNNQYKILNIWICFNHISCMQRILFFNLFPRNTIIFSPPIIQIYILFNLDIFDNYAWMNYHFLSINNIFYLEISQFNWPLDAIERQIGRLVNFSWDEKSNRRKFRISRIELGSTRPTTKNLTIWAIEFLLPNFILLLFISSRNWFYKKKKKKSFRILHFLNNTNNIIYSIRIFLVLLAHLIAQLLAILQIPFRRTILLFLPPFASTN